ncbi:MAG: glycosyltransferase [Candidatus Magasanikbacteria bacterium]
MKKPEFSILMANYNNAKYLKQAIESVLNQTYINWELIIVDDCSVDNSVDIIKKYLKDSRIIFLKHKKNIGYVGVLKKMISLASSDLIGILDSDDALKKKAVEEVVSCYLKMPEIGMVYTQFQYCDKDLNPVKNGYCQEVSISKSTLDCDVVSHFKTFKKSVYLKTEGYNEFIIYAEDKDLVFKLEEVTKMFFLDKILYDYRVLENSQGNDKKKSFRRLISLIKARKQAYKRRKNTNKRSSFLSFWLTNVKLIYNNFVRLKISYLWKK